MVYLPAEVGLRPKLRLVIILILCLALLAPAATALAADGPGRTEVSGAELYLKRFESHVKRMNGKAFGLRFDDKEALKRIKKLKEKYPDDLHVEALFQRARKALMASKGDYFTITPAMLAYREQEKMLREKMDKIAQNAWQDLLAKMRQDPAITFNEQAFPCPDPANSDPDKVIGTYVFLDDIRFPDNEFRDMGGQYLYMGSGAKGFYYISLSNRSWLGAYEAVKRYRRQVTQDTPNPWQVLGKITNVVMLIPDSSKEKVKPPAFGWLVEPVALYAPDRVLAFTKPENELGGEFQGEAQLAEIKKSMYTVKGVPDDVEPMKLVEIFATAIKEKNWPLYLDCIDPARKKTPTAIKRLQYFYDNNLERYRRWYVYVLPVKAKPLKVIKGQVVQEGSTEDYFLSDEQKKTIAKRTDPLVEEVKVEIRTYDENGKQSAMPKDVVLRRFDGGRWYIASGYPL